MWKREGGNEGSSSGREVGKGVGYGEERKRRGKGGRVVGMGETEVEE